MLYAVHVVNTHSSVWIHKHACAPTHISISITWLSQSHQGIISRFHETQSLERGKDLTLWVRHKTIMMQNETEVLSLSEEIISALNTGISRGGLAIWKFCTIPQLVAASRISTESTPGLGQIRIVTDQNITFEHILFHCFTEWDQNKAASDLTIIFTHSVKWKITISQNHNFLKPNVTS